MTYRPASCQVVHVRRGYNLIATQAVVTTVAPPAVLDERLADASPPTSVFADKLLYHVPYITNTSASSPVCK